MFKRIYNIPFGSIIELNVNRHKATKFITLSGLKNNCDVRIRGILLSYKPSASVFQLTVRAKLDKMVSSELVFITIADSYCPCESKIKVIKFAEEILKENS